MRFLKRLLFFVFNLINRLLGLFRFELQYRSAGLENKRSVHEFLLRIRPESQKYKLIRIGSKHDGGYLIPDLLDGVKYCYSPGVSTNSDFEDQLTTNGIECFLADYSVEGPAKSNPLFHFKRKYIGNKNDSKTITLKEWIKENKSDEEMLLQMDIEGAEYQVIFETPVEVFKKFRVLVIEFHGFNKLSYQYSFDLITTSFYKLLNDFRIVHVHANNCCRPVKIAGDKIPPVMEFTFLRKDHFYESSKLIKLPHELDSPNLPNRKEVELPSLIKGEV
jgi:hypothetical protein